MSSLWLATRQVLRLLRLGSRWSTLKSAGYGKDMHPEMRRFVSVGLDSPSLFGTCLGCANRRGACQKQVVFTDLGDATFVGAIFKERDRGPHCYVLRPGPSANVPVNVKKRVFLHTAVKKRALLVLTPQERARCFYFTFQQSGISAREAASRHLRGAALSHIKYTSPSLSLSSERGCRCSYTHTHIFY